MGIVNLETERGESVRESERLKSVRSDSPPLQTEYEGALYHIIGRGNERKRIFTGEDDHTRFLERDRTDRGKLKIDSHSLKEKCQGIYI